MKKKLVLALATLMCISLCACGNEETQKDTNEESNIQNEEVVVSEEEEFTLLGEWIHVKNGEKSGIIYTLKEDGLCVVTNMNADGSLDYKYEVKEDLNMVTFYGSKTTNYNIVEENGIYTLQLVGWGDVFVKTEDYEQYMQNNSINEQESKISTEENNN